MEETDDASFDVWLVGANELLDFGFVVLTKAEIKTYVKTLEILALKIVKFNFLHKITSSLQVRIYFQWLLKEEFGCYYI